MPNGYLTILPNGDVIPCMLLQTKLGNIREESVTQIWNISPNFIKAQKSKPIEGGMQPMCIQG